MRGQQKDGQLDPDDKDKIFDESLVVEDEKDRLMTDKYKGVGVYKNQMKIVEKGVDQENSLTRKTKKKRKGSKKGEQNGR